MLARSLDTYTELSYDLFQGELKPFEILDRGSSTYDPLPRHPCIGVSTSMELRATMPRKNSSRLQIRGMGDVGWVRISHARNCLRQLCEEGLQQYNTIIIEKSGEPLAVLKRPEDEQVRVHRF